MLRPRHLTLPVLACCMALFGPAHPASARRPVFQPTRAPFSINGHGITFNYRLQSIFVVPGETVRLSVLDADYKHEYDFTANTGEARAEGDRAWSWTAPLVPGFYAAVVQQRGSGETIQIQSVVLIPAAEVVDGRLRGYPIGEYPPELDDADPHLPPKGFVEITAENQGTSLTPHFTLGRFACPQPPVFPRYAVIDERLLVKLEALLEGLNNQGHFCRSLILSSAYRTPAYNQKRHHARYSAHQWGQAADVVVDGNGDGCMDDLSRDGRVDVKDAKIVYDIINSLDGTMRYQDFIGGLGLYQEGGGAFVHVDVRGSIARWEQVMEKQPRRHWN